MTTLETRINDLNHSLSLTTIEIDAWSAEIEINEACALADTEIAIVVANLLQTLNAQEKTMEHYKRIVFEHEARLGYEFFWLDFSKHWNVAFEAGDGATAKMYADCSQVFDTILKHIEFVPWYRL